MQELNKINSVSQLKYILNIAMIASKDNTSRTLLGWERELGFTYPYPVTRNILKYLILHEVMEVGGHKHNFPTYTVNKKKMKELLESLEVLTLTREVLDIYGLLF